MHQAISRTFETSVYRKVTNADIVLHYDSVSPASQKCLNVTPLLGRIKTHCSNAKACNQEGNYLHRPFGNNGYSLNFIKRALPYWNTQPPPITNGETVPSPVPDLPYVKTSQNWLPETSNFVIAQKPIKLSRGTLVDVKDTLPILKQRNMVDSSQKV